MKLFDAKPAAEILAIRRLRGVKGDRLAESLRPKSLADGFAVQQQVIEYWCAHNSDKVAGWKCLLPPEGKWVVAPIYASTVFSDSHPAKIWPVNDIARIEPELAFEIGKEIPARASDYSHREIDQSIECVHMALELIDGRYTDPSACDFPELLADGLFNQGLVVGPVVDRGLAYGAGNIEISIACDGQIPRIYDGKHQNQDPVAPLYWLVNFLRTKGIALHQGQYVITGSYAGVIEVPLTTEIHMSYLGLGKMSANFTSL